VDRLLLLTLSKALGNDKPPILLKCEKIIFGHLLDIALGKKNVTQAINCLTKDLPWADLQTLAVADKNWFKGGLYSIFCLR
jgi:hypothetical protein